jgi:hypothetical protein
MPLSNIVVRLRSFSTSSCLLGSAKGLKLLKTLHESEIRAMKAEMKTVKAEHEKMMAEHKLVSYIYFFSYNISNY